MAGALGKVGRCVIAHFNDAAFEVYLVQGILLTERVFEHATFGKNSESTFEEGDKLGLGGQPQDIIYPTVFILRCLVSAVAIF